MFADTSAIDAYGTAQTRHAADLAAITSRLAAAGQCRTDALGPVGARFVAALADATQQQARLVAGLADRMAAAATSAHSSADAYRASEQRAGHSLTDLGT